MHTDSRGSFQVLCAFSVWKLCIYATGFHGTPVLYVCVLQGCCDLKVSGVCALSLLSALLHLRHRSPNVRVIGRWLLLPYSDLLGLGYFYSVLFN